jgi:hypothetical protein
MKEPLILIYPSLLRIKSNYSQIVQLFHSKISDFMFQKKIRQAIIDNCSIVINYFKYFHSRNLFSILFLNQKIVSYSYVDWTF